MEWLHGGLEKFNKTFFQYTWIESYMIHNYSMLSIAHPHKNGKPKKKHNGEKMKIKKNQKKFIEKTRRLLSP